VAVRPRKCDEENDGTAEQANQIRPDVKEVFHNPGAFLRLATAVVIEAHDDWQVTRRYVSDLRMDGLREIGARDHRPSMHDLSGVTGCLPAQTLPNNPSHYSSAAGRHSNYGPTSELPLPPSDFRAVLD